MVLREFFRFKRWKPDLEREAPPQREWPDGVIALRSNKFDDFIEKYPVSIVDFWAPWCKPCKVLASRIRYLSKMYKGTVAFGKLNIDRHRDIAKQYHIMSIPKLIFFSYGRKVTDITGVKPIRLIQSKIDSMLLKFKRQKI